MFLFFYLPIFLAFFWAFHLERPFGGGSQFVGWQNFERVTSDPEFWRSLKITVIYMVLGHGQFDLLRACLRARRRPGDPAFPHRTERDDLAEGSCHSLGRRDLPVHLQPVSGDPRPPERMVPGALEPPDQPVPRLGDGLHRQYLERDPVHLHNPPDGSSGHPRQPSQGGRHRRRGPLAAALRHSASAPDAATLHRRGA